MPADVGHILLEGEDEECPCCGFPNRVPPAPGAKPEEPINQTDPTGTTTTNNRPEEPPVTKEEQTQQPTNRSKWGGLIVSLFIYGLVLVLSSIIVFSDKLELSRYIDATTQNRDSWVFALVAMLILLFYSFYVGFSRSLSDYTIMEPYRWLPFIFTATSFPLIMAEPTRRWLIDLHLLNSDFFGLYRPNCPPSWECLSTAGILFSLIFTYVGYALLLVGILFHLKIGVSGDTSVSAHVKRTDRRRVSSRLSMHSGRNSQRNSRMSGIMN